MMTSSTEKRQGKPRREILLSRYSHLPVFAVLIALRMEEEMDKAEKEVKKEEVEEATMFTVSYTSPSMINRLFYFLRVEFLLP